MKKALMNQSMAFGDICLTAPIAKYYHYHGWSIYWPARKPYFDLISHFDYVTPILLNDESFHPDPLRSDSMKVLAMAADYDGIIDLADRGSAAKQRYDENFEMFKFRISGVPWEEKYKLIWRRDENKERELYNLLVTSEMGNGYVFTHLGNSHGDFAEMPSVNLPVIEVREIQGFCIFDWFSIILGAKSIFCVESAFHQFIDGCGDMIKAPKFLLKKGVVESGFRHTVSHGWDFKYIGETILRG